MSQKAFNYLGFEDTGTKGSIDDFAKFQTKLKNMEKFKFDDATKDIGMSGEEAAQRLIEIFIKKISIKNPKFLCEYFIFHAQKELEAYQKAMPDNVNIISDSIRSNNFIEIDIHKTIIKAAKRLLEKLK